MSCITELWVVDWMISYLLNSKRRWKFKREELKTCVVFSSSSFFCQKIVSIFISHENWKSHVQNSISLFKMSYSIFLIEVELWAWEFKVLFAAFGFHILSSRLFSEKRRIIINKQTIFSKCKIKKEKLWIFTFQESALLPVDSSPPKIIHPFTSPSER